LFAHNHDLRENVIVSFDLMEIKLLDMHLPDEFDLEIHLANAYLKVSFPLNQRQQ
jgi:hypothetical protein